MSDKVSLEGRTVVVTGGGSGIGAGMAAEFHRAGARVAILDVDGARAERVARDLASDGDRVLSVTADVSDATSVRSAAGVIRTRLGHVDTLLSNAGVFDDFSTLLETPDELWDRVLAVNLKGTYVLAREFLPAMLERQFGVIITTASVASIVAGAGGPAYTAAKHGLIGLTRQMAYEYGKGGVRVNAILPGGIESEMAATGDDPNAVYVQRTIAESPAGRRGRPEEIGRVAVLLAGDHGAFFHGSSVVVDGGWTIS